MFWEPGAKNLGDYFTKHHPPSYHRDIQFTYFVNAIQDIRENLLRGCADMGPWTELGTQKPSTYLVKHGYKDSTPGRI